jgi:hypothetical protein
MAKKLNDEEKIVDLKKGVGLTITNTNHFRFQNIGAETLCIL